MFSKESVSKSIIKTEHDNSVSENGRGSSKRKRDCNVKEVDLVYDCICESFALIGCKKIKTENPETKRKSREQTESIDLEPCPFIFPDMDYKDWQAESMGLEPCTYTFPDVDYIEEAETRNTVDHLEPTNSKPKDESRNGISREELHEILESVIESFNSIEPKKNEHKQTIKLDCDVLSSSASENQNIQGCSTEPGKKEVIEIETSRASNESSDDDLEIIEEHFVKKNLNGTSNNHSSDKKVKNKTTCIYDYYSPAIGYTVYECYFCNTTFIYKFHSDNHFCKGFSEECFVCHFCDKRFSTYPALQYDHGMHHGLCHCYCDDCLCHLVLQINI